ncbi:hypothetical protein BKA69DRAFT_1044452, partial [Paraphysoderma sedebokerense]
VKFVLIFMFVYFLPPPLVICNLATEKGHSERLNHTKRHSNCTLRHQNRDMRRPHITELFVMNWATE